MKYSKKNSPTLARLIGLGIISGTLFWELLMRILFMAGIALDLTAGPIGFDSGVLEIWLSVNPGTAAGAAAGWYLFTRI